MTRVDLLFPSRVLRAVSAAMQARLADLLDPVITVPIWVDDDEGPPDPTRACMICARNPRAMSVAGGGQVCTGCAGDVPVEMLTAGRGSP